MNNITTPNQRHPWQAEKRIRSGDRVWIVTDTRDYLSGMYGCSTEQRFYRVGGLDLSTNRLGYFTFTTDDVRAMLKAGVPPAPWTTPRDSGVEVTRFYHGDTDRGRFREEVCLIDLDPGLLAQGPKLRSYFTSLKFDGNSYVGMWNVLVARVGLERSIETAALGMASSSFAARDVKAVVGAGVNVTPVLSALVERGQLVMSGTKRGARYERPSIWASSEGNDAEE